MTQQTTGGFPIDEHGIVIVPSGVAPGYPNTDSTEDTAED